VEVKLQRLVLQLLCIVGLESHFSLAVELEAINFLRLELHYLLMSISFSAFRVSIMIINKVF